MRRAANPHLNGMSRKLLTTGQAANLMGVSARTVICWCNKGLLGSRRLPGSQDRRISREELRLFAAQQGWPDPLGEAVVEVEVEVKPVEVKVVPIPIPLPPRLVLLYGLAEGFVAANCYIRREGNAFDVALQVQAASPCVIVVDVGAVGAEAAGELRRWVGGRPQPRPSLVAVYPEDVVPDPAGWAFVLRRPCSAVEIAAAVERVVRK